MARDVSAEIATLEILDRLAPTPLAEKTLARELDIAIDRQLTLNEFNAILRSLEERRMIKRSYNRMDLPIATITETGRAVVIIRS